MSDREKDPLIGFMCGEYRVLELIGTGGMGRVYKARHDILGKEVALKVLGSRVDDDEQYVQRFLREAKVASSLKHPGLVQVFDCGHSEHGYYMVMELIKGMSLGVLLASNGKLPEDQILAVAEAVLLALNHAHSAGVIHRDIKPDNILIDDDGTLKLTDLGLAKASIMEEDAGLTQSGMVLGTPYYVSPEQIQGSKNVDCRTDLYSLGATLFFCATGQYPYSGESSAVIMNKHLNDPVPNARQKGADLSEPTTMYIMRLMNKNPEYRFSNATEALAALDRIRTLKANPQQKVDEVVFIEETKLSDRLTRLLLPAVVTFLLTIIILWSLFRPTKNNQNELPAESPKVITTQASPNTKSVVPDGKGDSPKQSADTPTGSKSTDTAATPRVPEIESSTIKAGTYRVQLPQMIHDGFFAESSDNKSEITHADVLQLRPGQPAYVQFELTDIWQRLQEDLGQVPEVKAVHLILQADTSRLKKPSLARVYKVTRSLDEGLQTSERPLSEVTVLPGTAVVPLNFNVTEDVIQSFKGKQSFGWCVRLDGEGELLVPSAQNPVSKIIPALVLGIKVDTSKVPQKK